VGETVEVKMNKDQIKAYKMAMRGVDPKIVAMVRSGQKFDRSDKKLSTVFEQLGRARQVSNSLQSVVPGMTVAESAESTPKIRKVLDDALDHIRETPDAQVIMYTNFVNGGVDVLEAGLKRRGIPYGVFAGRGVPGMTEENRQKNVEDYLAGKKKVIIITGAGAEGLSLGNTTMVQVVDGHYNPERMAQAEARGIRAGGLSHRPQDERKVQVKRYVSTLPRGFWKAVTLQPKEKSVGQFVYSTAGRKADVTGQLRDVLAERSEHDRKMRESTVYRLTHRKNP
jgi:superfamily II DNA/RNA helicase